MMNFIRKPFGYEPIITKEDLKKDHKKKVDKASDWKGVLKGIWNLVDEQRFLLVIVLLMVVVSSALALLGPYLIGVIMDDHIPKVYLSGLCQNNWSITFCVLVFLDCYLFTKLLDDWHFSANNIIDFVQDCLNHLQKLPVSFFDKRQHGELMSRMTNDIENVSQTLNSSFIQVFSSILTLVGTTVVMLLLSPLMTLLTLIIVPFMYFAMRWITKRTSKLFKEQQKAVGELNGMIEETISGQRIVKHFKGSIC